jgi:hypothetical protein
VEEGTQNLVRRLDGMVSLYKIGQGGSRSVAVDTGQSGVWVLGLLSYHDVVTPDRFLRAGCTALSRPAARGRAAYLAHSQAEYICVICPFHSVS